MNFETLAEERFYNILVDYEIGSMLQSIYSQYWIDVSLGMKRRIDFVLVIREHSEFPKKIFIEIDGSIHKQEEKRLDDRFREQQIKVADFPLLRFKNKEIFNNPENVANKIQAEIELLEGMY